jgi:proteasome lid subunit RPN8/RPN11
MDLFRLMREIRAAGEEFVGIYHSHPAGENRPSARDLELAYYPEVAYVIVSPRGVAAQSGAGIFDPERSCGLTEAEIV